MRAVLMQQARSWRSGMTERPRGTRPAPAFGARRRRRSPREFARQRKVALEAAAASADVAAGSRLSCCSRRPAARAALASHLRRRPIRCHPTSLSSSPTRSSPSLEDWTEARRRHEALESCRRRLVGAGGAALATLGDLARTAEGLGELAAARELYVSALERLEARRGRYRRDRGRICVIRPRDALRRRRAGRAAGGRTEPAAAALALAERGRASGLLARMAGAPRSPRPPRTGGRPAQVARPDGPGRCPDMAGRPRERRADAGAPRRRGRARGARGEAERPSPRWLDAVAPPVATIGADEVRDALPEGSVLIEHLLVRGARARSGP